MTDAHPPTPDLDTVFAALAHEVRRHVLLAVWLAGGEMLAGHIAERFSHSWPTTTRHLRVLEQAGLLRAERRGRTRVYRVEGNRLAAAADWLRRFAAAPVAQSVAATAGPSPGALLGNIARSYPETHDSKEGPEQVFKVAGRPFLLLAEDAGALRLSAQLPVSKEAALSWPFTEPVRYKLGKNTWVAARFGPADEVPLELLWDWIEESYRAAAPRRLLAQLPAAGDSTPP